MLSLTFGFGSLLLAQQGTAPDHTSVAKTRHSNAPDAANAQVPASPKVSKAHARKAHQLYLEGARALEKQDIPGAEGLFEQAVKLDPHTLAYAVGYRMAREYEVSHLVTTAGRDIAAGKGEAAKEELAQAHAIDPDNDILAAHIDAHVVSPAVAAAQDVPTAQVELGEVEIQPSAGDQSFHSRATAPEMIRTVLTAYGVTPVLDESIQSTSVRMDVDDADYAAATSALRLVTGTFLTPLDEHRVLVAKDSPENRVRFERLSAETIYLPGFEQAELQDAANLLRGLFELKSVTVEQQQGHISIRAPRQTLEAVNQSLGDLLEPKPQVLLDIRLIQINKMRTRDIGAQLPQQFQVFNLQSELTSVINQNQSTINQAIAAGLIQSGNLAEIAAFLVAQGLATSSILSTPFATFGNGLTLTGLTFGQGITANLSLNSSDTREIDHVQFRLANQDTATLRNGTRYPVITSSFSNLASSSALASALNPTLAAQLGVSSTGSIANNAAPPQVQFEDLGLTVKATPQIERTGVVHLNLDFKLQALAGAVLNSIPALSSEQFTTNVTIKDGATALVISNLSKSQTEAVSGIPGLSELPGLTSTTNRQTQYNFSDLVMEITPHIVRQAHPKEAGPMIVLNTRP